MPGTRIESNHDVVDGHPGWLDIHTHTNLLARLQAASKSRTAESSAAKFPQNALQHLLLDLRGQAAVTVELGTPEDRRWRKTCQSVTYKNMSLIGEPLLGIVYMGIYVRQSVLRKQYIAIK